MTTSAADSSRKDRSVDSQVEPIDGWIALPQMASGRTDVTIAVQALPRFENLGGAVTSTITWETSPNSRLYRASCSSDQTNVSPIA